MRIVSLFFVILCLVIKASSQTPDWQWAVPIYSEGDEISSDVVADQASNSVYMIGEWTNSLSTLFPTGTNPGEDFSATYGQTDGYVAKFNQNGALLWAFKLGGPGDDFIDEIVVDDAGNIYITGYIGPGTGDAYLSGTSPITGASTISNLANDDCFIAKYNSDGGFLWMQRSLTDAGHIRGLDLAVNSTSVFLSGSYESVCTIGSLSISQVFGGLDLFLAKFDTNGNEEWVIVGGSDDDDYANAIVADEDNLFVTGNFAGSQIELKRLDGTTISIITNTFNGWEDGFIFSYDSDGIFRWAGSISTSYRAFTYDIAHDNDSIYFTGMAEGSISFPLYSGNPLNSSLKKDIFLVSMAKSNGNTGWVHLIPGTNNGDEQGNSVALDPSGAVLLTGNFRGDLQFPDLITLSSLGSDDIFVAKYSSDGSFIWALNAGSAANDIGYGVSAGTNGDIYVSGRYDEPMTLGTLPQLPDASLKNAFISKLSETSCTDAIGGSLSSTLTEICAGGSTNLILSTYSGEITWQSSPAGTSIWTDIPGETLPDIVVSPIVNTDYRAYLRNGACKPDSSNIITITVFDEPVSNPGTGNDEVCGDTYAFQALLSTGGSGKWTSTGPGITSFSLSDSDPNAIVTVSQYGSYDFTWTETNGVCVDDSTVTLVFYEPPTINAGPGGDVCGLTFTLGAIPSIGTGTWSQTGGPGTSAFAPSISNPDAEVTVSEYGSYSFSWTEINGPCSPTATIFVNFHEQPISYAGPDGDICITDGLYPITGSTSSNGTILWTTSGDGTFSDPSIDNPIYTIGSETGSVTLTKTVTSPGSCAPAVDFMILTLTPEPAVYAGPDAEICISDGFYAIDLSTSDNGSILWTTSGDGTFSDPSIDNPIYTIGSETGSVTLTKTVTSPGSCTSATDFMVLTLSPTFTANPGSGGEECDLDFQFNATLSGGTGVWNFISGPGTPNFLTPGSDPNAIIEVDAHGIYEFEWTETNGSCSDKASVIVSFFETPDANAGIDGGVCGYVYNLRALPSAGTGTWTKYSGPGNVSFSPTINDPLNTVTVDQHGSYTFIWTEENGPCLDSDSVTVIFHEQPIANSGTDINVCGLTTGLDAISSSGSGEWSLVNGPGTIELSPDSNDPQAVLTVTEYGTYQMKWEVSNSICTDFSVVNIAFYKQTEANAGPDQSLVYQFSTTLDAVMPIPGTGTWQSLNTGVLISNLNDPMAEVSKLSVGENIFIWHTKNGVCPEDSDEVTITVSDIETPTVITPNEDGLNDQLIFPGLEEHPGSKIIIYNRWGTEVFRDNDYTNDWKGKDQKDRDLQSDTYYYILSISNGRQIKGFIEIRR